MPIDAQGTTVTFNDGVTAQVIGGIVSFDWSKDKPEKDRTTLASTAKESAFGLPDPGTLVLNIFYDDADVGQAAVEAAELANATREVVFTQPNGTVRTFNANPKPVTFSGAVDGDYNAVMELRATGPVVIT